MIASLTALGNGNSRSVGAKHARGCRSRTPKRRKELIWAYLHRPLLSPLAARASRRSCWGRRPQPGNQHQILANIWRDTATSAIWNVTSRPWRTTLAPTLISFSRKLVSDHGSADFGIARVRMKLSRL